VSATKDRLVLGVVATDATFELKDVRGERVWVGKCIHCQSALVVGQRGQTFGATLEHIVARAHGGTDELRNLALACARCNHGKGVRTDRLRPSDPRVVELRAKLELRRAERWRDPA
jgi:5-methylcytosine-specific restriction endonuclease McrA